MIQESDPFGAYRGRLMGLAYRMLGSMTDAEDVLQDAYLRCAETNWGEVNSAEAYLKTTVTRLCLDRLKSARAQREIYVGPWLPEPIVDTEAISPETALELADDLSFALLLTLERLSGAERAAFLLHDIFDTPFSEVSTALGKSESACRKLASRARKSVRDNHATRKAVPSEHEALLTEFVGATASGNASQLLALLAENVVAYTDGGGVKTAALNPIIGADKVARFFTGLAVKARRLELQISFAPSVINGAPALLMYVDGELDQTISIETDSGKIKAFYAVRNPEKLIALSANAAR